MDNKGQLETHSTTKYLMDNEAYFKYVFKKTEKVVSAVFYVTRSLSDATRKDILVSHVEAQSQGLLDAVKKTLATPEEHTDEALRTLRAELISFESALALLAAARILRRELFEVFLHEIASLHRNLKDYYENTHGQALFNVLRTGDEVAHRRPKVAKVVGERKTEVAAGTPSRSDRIMSIIKEKGQVTIKDISTAITDVSEKTIQRELMSLISNGQISKTGERRWSRYHVM